MAVDALRSYFMSAKSGYGQLVENLIRKTEELSSIKPSDTLRTAQRQYIVNAIFKGADLSHLPEEIAFMEERELEAAIQNIPDKKATGWSGPTALIEEDRLSFDRAGQARGTEVHKEIFAENANKLILGLEGSAKSVSGQVDAFLESYSEKALENYKTAYAADEAARLQDPKAHGKAGRHIAQQLIRRDPNSSSRLQIYAPEPAALTDPNWKPDERKWKEGPKLGKFLQDRYEWALYDVLQRETSVQVETEHFEEKRKLSLGDVANRDYIAADQFDIEDFAVVISRDAQHLGEMSTGQRWRSCMASDGVNYHYVPRDIQAGTLVAYLVHKDDTDARWPIMRQLIKPFVNDAGEAILVPARVYGGLGADSSLIRNAFTETTQKFAATHNAGMSGTFRMKENLYADGQATSVSIDGDWTSEKVIEAVRSFREGAFIEYRAEINANNDRIQNGQKGLHGEDPAQTNKKLVKNMYRLFDAENMETGLARMYYREALKMSMGAVPEPQQIIEAVKNDNRFKSLSAYATMCKKNDVKTYMEFINRPDGILTRYDRLLPCIIAPLGSKEEAFALEVFKRDHLSVITETNTITHGPSTSNILVQYIPGREPFHQAAAEHITAVLEKIKNPTTRFNVASSDAWDNHDHSKIVRKAVARVAIDIAPAVYPSWSYEQLQRSYQLLTDEKEYQERAAELLILHIKAQEKSESKLMRARHVYQTLRSPEQMEKLGQIILDNLGVEGNITYRLMIAQEVFSKLPKGSLVRSKAANTVLEHTSSCLEGKSKHHALHEYAPQLETVFEGLDPGDPLRAEAARLKHICIIKRERPVEENLSPLFDCLRDLKKLYRDLPDLKDRQKAIGESLLAVVSDLVAVSRGFAEGAKLYEDFEGNEVLREKAANAVVNTYFAIQQKHPYGDALGQMVREAVTISIKHPTSAQLMADKISALPDGPHKYETAQRFYRACLSKPDDLSEPFKEKVFDIAMNSILTLSELRLIKIEKLFDLANMSYGKAERTARTRHKIMDLSTYIMPEEQAKILPRFMEYRDPYETNERALKLLFACIPSLGSPQDRLRSLEDICAYMDEKTEFAEKVGRLIFKDIEHYPLHKRLECISSQIIYKCAPPDSELIKQSRSYMMEHLHEVKEPELRIRYALQVRGLSADDPELYKRADLEVIKSLAVIPNSETRFDEAISLCTDVDLHSPQGKRYLALIRDGHPSVAKERKDEMKRDMEALFSSDEFAQLSEREKEWAQALEPILVGKPMKPVQSKQKSSRPAKRKDYSALKEKEAQRPSHGPARTAKSTLEA